MVNCSKEIEFVFIFLRGKVINLFVNFWVGDIMVLFLYFEDGKGMFDY